MTSAIAGAAVVTGTSLMFSIVGHVILWCFAVLGILAAIGGVMSLVDIIKKGTEKPAVEPPKPEPYPFSPLRPQIANLRPIPQPEPDGAQVLQKTTMQITTTKYVDPNAGRKELSDGK